MVLKVIFAEDGFKYQSEGYTELGTEFSVIEKVCCRPEEWKRTIDKEFGHNAFGSIVDAVYAFLFYKNGSYVRPLYRGQYNHLMSDTGFLFKDLSFNEGYNPEAETESNVHPAFEQILSDIKS